jgi:thiosulfate/3-mercaptopyruvate sulfurtransferase
MLTEPGYPEEAAQRPGHIPGALSIPWDHATREDGSFKSPEELEALFTASYLDRQTPAITYCRIGERSAHTWFVLHELLGWSALGEAPGFMPVTGREAKPPH